MRKIRRPKIADIYGEVANCVNKYLETQDHETHLNYTTSDGVKHEIDIRPICQSMSGNINRKITKRNTMTFPYNVSMYGMREQLRDDIIKDYEGTDKQFWTGEGWLASRVLADLNYRGIEEVVKGAVICRDFLKDLTKEVCEKGEYIYYKTPFINFPVIHRVTRTNVKRIATNLGALEIKEPTNNLHISRMVNGIAPNFVHSLDATLMYMTIQKLIDKGVRDYALIHDSFGVHARYAEELQLKVREAYVELFEEDVLQQFVDVVAPFKTGAVKDLMIDDLDLQQVHDSPYMFS